MLYSRLELVPCSNLSCYKMKLPLADQLSASPKKRHWELSIDQQVCSTDRLKILSDISGIDLNERDSEASHDNLRSIAAARRLRKQMLTTVVTAWKMMQGKMHSCLLLQQLGKSRYTHKVGQDWRRSSNLLKQCRCFVKTLTLDPSERILRLGGENMSIQRQLADRCLLGKSRSTASGATRKKLCFFSAAAEPAQGIVFFFGLLLRSSWR